MIVLSENYILYSITSSRSYVQSLWDCKPKCFGSVRECPLYPQKRTFVVTVGSP